MKRDIDVRNWQLQHPGGTINECVRGIHCIRDTAKKWWDPVLGNLPQLVKYKVTQDPYLTLDKCAHILKVPEDVIAKVWVHTLYNTNLQCPYCHRVISEIRVGDKVFYGHIQKEGCRAVWETMNQFARDSIACRNRQREFEIAKRGT